MVIQYYSHFTNEKPKAWWNWKVVATQKFADHQWSVIARINIKVAPASPHYSLLTKDSKLGAEAWTECRLKIKRKLPCHILHNFKTKTQLLSLDMEFVGGSEPQNIVYS